MFSRGAQFPHGPNELASLEISKGRVVEHRDIPLRRAVHGFRRQPNRSLDALLPDCIGLDEAAVDGGAFTADKALLEARENGLE